VPTGSSLTLYNLTVRDGKATNGTSCGVFNTCGGGVYSEGTLVLAHTTFADNFAVKGGGVYVAAGSLSIADSTFFNNSVSTIGQAFGGGVYNAGGSVTITDSIFSANSTGGGGGGGGVYNNATLTISGSTFSGNHADGNGGGIYNPSGSLNISRSTFFDNSSIAGGGMWVDTAATINGSTFSGNSGTLLGGGIRTTTVAATITNSIITNSPGGNCAGSIDGDGFSLDNDGSCTDFINSSSINLAALADNGGPTQTFALNPGSAALDSGSISCLNLADQRGITRGINGVGGIHFPSFGDCDVGAFESGGIIRTLQFASPSSSIGVGYTNTFPVMLTLNSALAEASNVTAYAWVSGGTALAGVDYEPFGVQTATVTPGNTTADVTINLLHPATITNKTIILSIATQRGPGFSGPTQLGTQRTHTVTLKATPPAGAANRNFYSTHTPTLTWNRISNATGYEIQVDTDTAFLPSYAFTNINIPADQLSIQTTSLANGTYYWRVRAKGGTGVWSAPERFEVFVVP
jgi:hypothetical protein